MRGKVDWHAVSPPRELLSGIGDSSGSLSLGRVDDGAF